MKIENYKLKCVIDVVLRSGDVLQNNYHYNEEKDIEDLFKVIETILETNKFLRLFNLCIKVDNIRYIKFSRATQ